MVTRINPLSPVERGLGREVNPPNLSLTLSTGEGTALRSITHRVKPENHTVKCILVMVGINPLSPVERGLGREMM
jgi:hypothetical protein